MISKPDADIDARHHVLLGRRRKGVGIYSPTNSSKASRELTTKLNKEVLLDEQIMRMAYLLGFDDLQEMRSPINEAPAGITIKTFKEQIRPRFQRDGIISIGKDILLEGVPHKSLAQVYLRENVESAFKELDEEFKLHYTPERFTYALSIVN